MRFAYDELRNSNAWDSRFDLPAVPMHLNPHIYAAYAVRILEAVAGDLNTAGALAIREQYAVGFLKSCEEEPGFLTTYPVYAVASHDDVTGAAFLNGDFAGRVVEYLSKHDGSYTDGEDNENANQYRFLYFLPMLRAHATGFRVGIVDQVLFILALLGNLWFTEPGSTDGHLLLWVGFPKMSQYPLVKAFIEYWSDKRTSQGLTPSSIFKTKYLTECPWFGDWAKETWK